jgi:hypothetical protein
MIKFQETKTAISGNHLNFSTPISKIDVEKRMVHGFATLDNLDRQGDVVPLEASIKAFESFRGNIREMHQPISVGKVVSFKEETYFDAESNKSYNGIYVSAYVSKGAQDTWEKVLDGTLSAFSIGGEVHDSEDVYDEELNKKYQVIKEYSLSELSLVDNPANQFANVISIEKGQGTGYLMKATIENVFWCRKDDVIQMSYGANKACPQCDKAMSNIGFVESNDPEKTSVIKGIITNTKKTIIQKNIDIDSYVKFDDSYGRVIDLVFKGGARLSSEEVAVMAKTDDPVVIIKLYSQKDGIIIPTNRRVIKNISLVETVNAISKSEVKEVSKMNSDIIVVDEIEKSMSEEQINPPMEDAIPVTMVDTQKAIEIEVTEEDEEDSEDEMAEKAYSGAEEEKGDMSDEAKKAISPSAVSEEDVNATTKMIDTINDHLTSALSTLAETVKALDAKIEGINKAIAGVSNEVSEVKDSFGKRVDAVEKDTAFRKSADLGEILQEQPIVVKKSLWGGSFLKNADLFK